MAFLEAVLVPRSNSSPADHLPALRRSLHAPFRVPFFCQKLENETSISCEFQDFPKREAGDANMFKNLTLLANLTVKSKPSFSIAFSLKF